MINFFQFILKCNDFIQKIYSIPKSKIVHLPLPGDASILDDYHQVRKIFRKKYKIKESDIVLVHTGKLPQEKETLLVLKSFLKLEGDNFKLIIAEVLMIILILSLIIICQKIKE